MRPSRAPPRRTAAGNASDSQNAESLLGDWGGTRRPMVTKLRLLAALSAVAFVLVMPSSASPSNAMLLGLFDDAVTLDQATDNFPLLSSLHVQVTRVTL